MKIDLDKLETSLAKQEQYERGLNYNFAHAERLEILNQIPALIAELRELRAGEARAVEELKKLGPLGSSNQELFMVPWGEIKQRIQELEAAALRAGEVGK